MVVSSKENPMETDNSEDSTMEELEETVLTIPTATKTAANAPEVKEFDLHYDIPVRPGDSIDDHLQLHLQLLQLLTEFFHDSDLHILDITNQRAQDFHEPKWRNHSYYDYHYTHQVDDAECTTTIAHRIQTVHPSRHITSHPSIQSYLHKTRTYLTVKESSTDFLPLAAVQSSTNTLSQKEPTQISYKKCSTDDGAANGR
jgi:hypothetical protein